MAAAEDESADRSADPIDSEEHRAKRKKKKKKHERLVVNRVIGDKLINNLKLLDINH